MNGLRLHIDSQPELTTDDGKRLDRIVAARNDDDYGAVARMVAEFYQDDARRRRTPRWLMLCHIGMLCSALAAAAGEPMDD